MGYKHRADLASVMAALQEPNYLLKIMLHVDDTPQVCEFVKYCREDIDLKGSWVGPASLSLWSHAPAPLAELPVLEVVSATDILADLTLGLDKVVHDYLAESELFRQKGSAHELTK
jgi:acetoacetate decarboxylase